jgi:transketolase C-terminal domain/subunit
MIRADRELLADLARMNSDVVPLAIKIMGDSATAEEQRTFASRFLELGTHLNHRARQSGLVIDCDTIQEPSP